ncbi:hypothetical protein [Pseudonocardia pini]|uniref:hypothetical protein n=1 Tax=Pseudonocardia pini TaxID=2758030 RepID=UPI0015F11FCE|nr:hypothetical protein [Pseudonocardia pini]
MPDRHTQWGASGWGCNAREPWAAPLFTGEPTAAQRVPASVATLVALAVVFVLLAGAAYLYAALALL